MPLPVTGLVLTLNGERHLTDTLDSLGFCDELLVVDSQSTDRTREIAEAAGARFLVNPWQGPAAQFEFAFKQITTSWVVSLDQDEVLTPALRQSIREALADPGENTGFYCSRTSFYLDRFLRHSGWYPDWLLRVFRLDGTKVEVSPPHYGFKPQGPTRRLSGDILHYPYADLAEHLAKINAYTQSAAEDLAARGKNGGLLPALGHGLARFAKHYLLRLGFLDGRAGFVLAVNGFYYGFNKYIRVAEIRAGDKREVSDQ